MRVYYLRTSGLPAGSKTESRGRDTTACGTLPAGPTESKIDALVSVARDVFPGLHEVPENFCGNASTLFNYTLTQDSNNSLVVRARAKLLSEERLRAARRLQAQIRKTVLENRKIYKYRVITSGDQVEILRYGMEQLSKKGVPVEKGTRKMTEKELIQKQHENEIRARRGLIRTVNANIGQWGNERPKFFTMTFNPENETRDLSEAARSLKEFLQRLRRRLKRNIHYTCVARFQDGHRPGGAIGGRNGIVHFHIVFYDLPYIPQTELTKMWGKGFVWINAIEDVDNLGVYLVEGYMGKEMDDERLRGKKKYWSSRDLHKPVVELVDNIEMEKRGLEGKEPVYIAEYESDWVGDVRYEVYNKLRQGKMPKKRKRRDSDD